MNYFPLTTLLAATPADAQGVNNTSALIAALSGLLGAVIGSTATIIVARISARAEDRRHKRRLGAELSTLEQTRTGELERQIREAAVGLSNAWEHAIQAHDSYRTIASMPPQEAGEERPRMVRALTRIGSQLNALLVLPINESLEAQIFAIDKVVDLFRGSIDDPKQGVHYRNAVSPEILKLFSILREGDLVRTRGKAGKVSGIEIPKSPDKNLLIGTSRVSATTGPADAPPNG